jgi:hypothetical protein
VHGRGQPVSPIDPARPASPSALVPRQAAKRKDLHTLAFLDWLSCFAIAVNEENACGGAYFCVGGWVYIRAPPWPCPLQLTPCGPRFHDRPCGDRTDQWRRWQYVKHARSGMGTGGTPLTCAYVRLSLSLSLSIYLSIYLSVCVVRGVSHPGHAQVLSVVCVDQPRRGRAGVSAHGGGHRHALQEGREYLSRRSRLSGCGLRSNPVSTSRTHREREGETE